MFIDINHKITSLVRRVALAMALAAGTSLASAGVIHVAVDTSNFGVASGFLDMQLSASSNVPLATAVVSNMVGFDSNAFIDSWGVTPVAGGYQFRNDTSNDLFHAVAFGGILSFDLTFDGVYDPVTQYVSHFVVSAFSEANALLGNYDPVTGALAEFTWTPALMAGGEGSVGVGLSDPGVHIVPEPADALLMGVALAAMAVMLRRRAPRQNQSALPLAA